MLDPLTIQRCAVVSKAWKARIITHIPLKQFTLLNKVWSVFVSCLDGKVQPKTIQISSGTFASLKACVEGLGKEILMYVFEMTTIEYDEKYEKTVQDALTGYRTPLHYDIFSNFLKLKTHLAQEGMANTQERDLLITNWIDSILPFYCLKIDDEGIVEYVSTLYSTITDPITRCNTNQKIVLKLCRFGLFKEAIFFANKEPVTLLNEQKITVIAIAEEAILQKQYDIVISIFSQFPFSQVGTSFQQEVKKIAPIWELLLSTFLEETMKNAGVEKSSLEKIREILQLGQQFIPQWLDPHPHVKTNQLHEIIFSHVVTYTTKNRMEIVETIASAIPALQFKCYVLVVKELYRQGKKEEAYSYLKQIPPQNEERPNAYVEIVLGALCHSIEEAHEVVDKIQEKDPYCKSKSQLVLVKAYLERVKIGKAEEVANCIENQVVQCEAYLEMVKTIMAGYKEQYTLGNHTLVKSMLFRTIGLAEKISLSTFKSSAFLTIMQALFSQDQASLAMTFIKNVTVLKDRFQIASEILSFFLRKENLIEAVKWINKVAPQEQSKAYQGVFSAFIKTNQLSACRDWVVEQTPNMDIQVARQFYMQLSRKYLEENNISEAVKMALEMMSEKLVSVKKHDLLKEDDVISLIEEILKIDSTNEAVDQVMKLVRKVYEKCDLVGFKGVIPVLKARSPDSSLPSTTTEEILAIIHTQIELRKSFKRDIFSIGFVPTPHPPWIHHSDGVVVARFLTFWDKIDDFSFVIEVAQSFLPQFFLDILTDSLFQEKASKRYYEVILNRVPQLDFELREKQEQIVEIAIDYLLAHNGSEEAIFFLNKDFMQSYRPAGKKMQEKMKNHILTFPSFETRAKLIGLFTNQHVQMDIVSLVAQNYFDEKKPDTAVQFLNCVFTENMDHHPVFESISEGFMKVKNDSEIARLVGMIENEKLRILISLNIISHCTEFDIVRFSQLFFGLYKTSHEWSDMNTRTNAFDYLEEMIDKKQEWTNEEISVSLRITEIFTKSEKVVLLCKLIRCLLEQGQKVQAREIAERLPFPMVQKAMKHCIEDTRPTKPLELALAIWQEIDLQTNDDDYVSKEDMLAHMLKNIPFFDHIEVFQQLFQRAFSPEQIAEVKSTIISYLDLMVDTSRLWNENEISVFLSLANDLSQEMKEFFLLALVQNLTSQNQNEKAREVAKQVPVGLLQVMADHLIEGTHPQEQLIYETNNYGIAFTSKAGGANASEGFDEGISDIEASPVVPSLSINIDMMTWNYTQFISVSKVGDTSRSMIFLLEKQQANPNWQNLAPPLLNEFNLNFNWNE